jgi:hypothetical protein
LIILDYIFNVRRLKMAKKRVKKVVEEVVNKKVPVGVQVISVLYYIAAALSLIAGIAFIAGANYIITLIPELTTAGIGAELFIALGIILIIMSVLVLFIGIGLWKLKPWARIVAVIISILGIVLAIYSMIKGFMWGDIVKLVIHGLIVWYLIYNKESVRAFK